MQKHVLALAFGTFALGIAEFSMMSILSPAAEGLEVSIPQAGHFISAYALGVCAGVLLMVVFARRIPLTKLLLLLAALIAVGNGAAALSPNYWLMIAARFVAGLPHGAFFGVGSIICTKLAKPGEASRDVCLAVAGMTVANLVGVPLGSFLAWAVSWRCAFAIVALVGLFVVFAVKRWVPDLPPLPDKGFAAQFRFLGSLQPWLVLGAIGFGNGGFFAYYSYVNPIIEDVAAIPDAFMSAVVTAAGAGMVLGNLLSAKLSLRITNPALACMGQGVLVASLVIVFFAAHWAPAAVVLTILIATAPFFISGPEQVLILENAKEGQLLAAALAQVAFNGGNALGAWLGGLPIERGLTAEWAALPGMCLAGIGFSLLLILWIIRRIKAAERIRGAA